MKRIKFDPKKDQLNLVALGDSIAESFNIEYVYGISGYFNQKDKTIHGISYPSILARMYQKAGIDIKYYENFAMSGSTSWNWNYFLNNNFKNYKKNKDFIETSIKLHIKNKENNKSRLNSQFKQFGKYNLNDFDYLKKRIKEANMILVNIGANDLKELLPFDKFGNLLLDYYFKTKQNPENENHNFDKEIEKAKKNLYKNISLMIENIQKINNKARIFVISYPRPLNRVAHLVDNIFRDIKNKEMNYSFTQKALDLITNILKRISQEKEVDFIDFFEEKIWYKNAKEFSWSFYDVHPSLPGYKKIAQEVFLKTTLSDEYFYDAENHKKLKEIITSYSVKHFSADRHLFQNFFNFGSSLKETKKILKISNIEKSDWLFKKDQFDKEYDIYLKKIDDFEYIKTSLKISDKKFKIFFDHFLNKLEIANIDPDNKFRKLFSKYDLNKETKTFFLNSQILNFSIRFIQNKMDQLENNNKRIKMDEFENIIFELLVNPDFLFIFLQNSLEILVLEENRKIMKDFKNTIYDIFYNYYDQESINNFFANFINESIIKILKTKNIIIEDTRIISAFIKVILKKKNMSLYFDQIIDSFLLLTKKRNEIKNFYDFVFFFVKEYIEHFDLNNLITILLEDEALKEIMVEMIISVFKLKNINKKNEETIKNFIDLLINKNKFSNSATKILLGFLSKKSQNPNFDIVKEWPSLIFNKESNIFLETLIELLDFKTLNHKILFSDFINLIYDKGDSKDFFIHKFVKELKVPKSFFNKSSKFSLINFSNEIFSKFKLLNDLYSKIISSSFAAYDNYLTHNNKDLLNNPYYKTNFRLVITTLIIAHSLFQKKLTIEIFWHGNEKEFQFIPSISGFLYKSFINGNKKNIKTKLANHIFGETSKKVNGKRISENNYSNNHILYYIRNYEKKPIDKYSLRTKEETLYDSIKEGYWK